MTTKKAPKRAPKGLAAAGRALWREVQGGYVLDPGEEAILAQACRLADVLTYLEGEMVGADATVTGSRGQPVANPLLAEIRLVSLALARLVRQLNLPQPRSAGAGARRGRMPGVVDMTSRKGGTDG